MIFEQVLWRYSGEKPETLGSNTRLYDWIPQNDLLGTLHFSFEGKQEQAFNT